MLIKKQFSEYNSLNNKKKIHANYNTTDAAGNDQSMLILTILEKIKESRFLKRK